MEVSWTTFILEIINFLVLVWILKHFLYKPVLDIIARRQADIDQRLGDARELQKQADEMREQYQGRVSEWEHERQHARETLHVELESERQVQLEKLNKELDEKKQRSEVAEQRRLADAALKLETIALRQGAQFATRLLEQASGPETQQRLLELLIEDVSKLAPQAISAIRSQYGDRPATAFVTSAFALDESERQSLQRALATLIDPQTQLNYEVDPALLAGVRIVVGAWELSVNVQDELRGFAELAENE